MGLLPPPASLPLPRWRLDLFEESGRLRHQLLLFRLSQPPLQLSGCVLPVAVGDPAVFDDVVEILTGDERLRPASRDILQARLLGNYVAEREPDAVRDLNERTDFTHELRGRCVNALLPRRTQVIS